MLNSKTRTIVAMSAMPRAAGAAAMVFPVFEFWDAEKKRSPARLPMMAGKKTEAAANKADRKSVV